MKFIITEEQSEKLNHKIKSMVNKYGVEETLRLFDYNKDIIRRTYQDNPSEYLNQFNDLSMVEKDNVIYYVDEDDMPLFQFYSDNTNKYSYNNVHRIWMFFSEIIGLDYEEIQDILKNWLEEVYNIKGLTPLPLVMTLPII